MCSPQACTVFCTALFAHHVLFLFIKICFTFLLVGSALGNKIWWYAINWIGFLVLCTVCEAKYTKQSIQFPHERLLRVS